MSTKREIISFIPERGEEIIDLEDLEEAVRSNVSEALDVDVSRVVNIEITVSHIVIQSYYTWQQLVCSCWASCCLRIHTYMYFVLMWYAHCMFHYPISDLTTRLA